MPIQKKAGYEPPENAYTGPGGGFIITLVEIKPPREVTSTYNGETRTRMCEEWQFALENGEMVWDPFVTSFNGDALSENSTMYKYAAALVGGSDTLEQKVFPVVNDLADLRQKLIGRQAIGNLTHPADGPVRIDSLSAIPASMLQQPAQAPTAAPQPVQQAEPTPVPAQAAPVAQQAPASPQPLRQQVAGESVDPLPF